MILLDGSQGEGGGQILRTSLALSMLTGKPFRMEKIRANRDKPGLMRQHLTAVNAATAISSAKVFGAAISSRELTFEPGIVRGGEYSFAVGTAGSTTLVLQTVLPALLLAKEASSLTLEGGTHNIHAPPLDFLEKAFLPIVARMGPGVCVSMERAGFYPAGGGRFLANVTPAPRLEPIDIGERGPIKHRLAKAVCAGLPGEIALRELKIVRDGLGWSDDVLQIRQLPEDQGPGNIFTIELGSENVTEVFTGFGQQGVTAEKVATDVMVEAQRYLKSGVPVGRHLADQLLIPFALAGRGSFLTQKVTRHTLTNIEVIGRFLDVRIVVEPGDGDQAWIRVGRGSLMSND
jgi:RNA 3'-terminal phosphate cyclase (ATP)